MKIFFFKRMHIIVAFFLIAANLTSCVHVHQPRRTVVVKHKRIPPGHAKKIYGDKSAKRYSRGNGQGQNEQ